MQEEDFKKIIRKRKLKYLYKAYELLKKVKIYLELAGYQGIIEYELRQLEGSIEWNIKHLEGEVFQR